MRILFFDTETTGNAERDRLCQLAICERGSEKPILNALFKPPHPIPFEAMAIHHITQKMVDDRPLFLEAPEYESVKTILEDEESVVVAHNAAFDLAMLAREGIVPRAHICTYKVARAVDKEEKLGVYQLQYLRYALGIEVEALAHDAMGDCLVLEALFERLLLELEREEGTGEKALLRMMALSREPLLFTTLRFGKYKGKRLEDIAKNDRGYLEWLLAEKRKNPSGEEDWIHTLEHYLAH